MNKLILLSLIFLSMNAVAQESNTTRALPKGMGVDAVPGNEIMDIRLEPHWLILDEIALDMQFRIGNQFSMGPTLSIVDYNDGIRAKGHVTEFFSDTEYSTKGQSVGVRAVYYFNDFFSHSPILSGYAKYGQFTVEAKPEDSFSSDPVREAEFNQTEVGVTAGYRWKWNKLTMNVGGGFGVYSAPDSITLKGGGTEQKEELEDDSINIMIDAGLGLTF